MPRRAGADCSHARAYAGLGGRRNCHVWAEEKEPRDLSSLGFSTSAISAVAAPDPSGLLAGGEVATLAVDVVQVEHLLEYLVELLIVERPATQESRTPQKGQG